MTAAFATMGFNTQYQNNHCIDPSDMDSFVDFGTLPSPTPTPGANGKAPMSRTMSAMTSPTTTIVPLDFEEQQAPIKPSHNYGQFKQQTGLPTGSYASLSGLPTGMDGFGSPDIDAGIGSSSMYAGMGSNSGLGIDDSMNFDMTSPTGLPAFFYPSRTDDDFVDPSAISAQEEQPQNVRFYPGMHQQQAAMAKAQQQAQQQRQQQIIQQQQQKRVSEQQARSQGSRKPATPIDARTEETIARVVNQIRQNSSFSADSMSPPSSVPHMSRSKKDEDDMDEDERLLASEEGKKLSSKERRQLRNKVSARAFRSRRKEYIGQLEGDIAGKVNECNDLKAQNRALMEENARFRELTVKLLRHPAFTPFLEDISRDPALSDSLNKVTSSMNASAAAEPAPAPSAPKDINTFSQGENLHIGMATIPETQLDFSALTLNGNNNWGMTGMTGFGFQQPQVFAVLEVPEGPADVLDVEALSGKGEESFLDRFSPAEDKEDYPVVETPTEAAPKAEEAVVDETVEFDESDPAFALYADIPVRSSTAAPAQQEPTESIFGDIAAEKAFARFELVLSNAATDAALEQRLNFLCARAERSFRHLQSMSSQFE